MTRAAPLILGPGGAIDQQRGGIDLGRAVGDRGLRQLQVAERRAEQLSRRGVLDHLVQRAAREAERRGADGRAEDVERRHRDLEALARRAEAVGHRHAARVELQRGERMRRDHVDALGDAEPGVSASTMKAERPFAPGASPVRANTT